MSVWGRWSRLGFQSEEKDCWGKAADRAIWIINGVERVNGEQLLFDFCNIRTKDTEWNCNDAGLVYHWIVAVVLLEGAPEARSMNWFKQQFDKLRNREIHLVHEILNTKCKSLKECKCRRRNNPPLLIQFHTHCLWTFDQWPVLVTGYWGNQSLDWPTECFQEALGEDNQVAVWCNWYLSWNFSTCCSRAFVEKLILAE